ncbi:MAG: CHAT domain-containing tetratricopeptide repeat protein [Pyrinomonadaceae bacterium]
MPSFSKSLLQVKRLLRASAWCLCLGILYPAIGLCQVSEKPIDITALETGKVVERQLSGGQKHVYEFVLTEGQFVGVEVDARGIAASIQLIDASGNDVMDLNVEPGLQTVDTVAEITGRQRIEISSKPTANAGTYTIRLPVARRAEDTELWRHQARRLSLKASSLVALAKYDEAKSLAEEALRLRLQVFGPDHIGVANSLQLLADINSQKGDYVTAEPLYLRSLVINEKILGLSSSGLVGPLNNLGILYISIGDLDKAEQTIRRSLAIQEQSSGVDHFSLARVLLNLASVHQRKGEYNKAELLYERSLAINEKAYGPNHPNISASLNALANLYQQRGDYSKSETYYQRALLIREKASGPEHDLVGNILLDLGNIYYRAGDLVNAESRFRRALQIYEKALGPEHPNVALALSNIGAISHDKGDFDAAVKLHQRALDIRHKKLNESHTAVGSSLTNLGNAYRGLGDYERAQSYYQRALAGREKAIGPDHPDVLSTLTNMALMQMAKGDLVEALALQSRIITTSERNADLNLVSGSERQKLAYLSLLSEQIDQAIALNTGEPQNPAAINLAVTTVLQRKGRVQDVLASNVASLRSRMNAADGELLDKFNKTTSQLAALVLGGPGRQTADEHRKRIEDLREERERIESDISRRSSEFRSRSQPVTVQSVRAALPDNAALLEFIAYNKFLPKGLTTKERRGELRYLVYVIRREGDIQWKDLGAAKTINDGIGALRKALRDPRRRDVKQLARTLDEKVMRPVRSLVGNATHLLISPAGDLSLLPFESLVTEKDRYLLEQYSVSYLTSGRDLLRMQVGRNSKDKPTVVANPSFGEPGSGQAAGTVGSTKPSPPGGQALVSARDSSDVYFAPLGGTQREALTIRTLFPDANLLTGAQATESALKKIAAPSVLHIATHGFFLEDSGAADSNVAMLGKNIENPLLRSGLAFAGANAIGDAGEDGILTALEASGLNLWGTKLVVLSACDTGLGEVRNGEGVYGLRRSFVLAGAESLVMSMWPVSDYVTRELMTSYYNNLKKGLGRGESLRQVQLEMIKKPNRRHPFYWASFIQSGEWANLEGKR